MNTNLSLLMVVNRELLEYVARRIICPCLYYELCDYVDGMSDDELLEIVFKGFTCEMCEVEGN